jgi:hypothetical protein
MSNIKENRDKIKLLTLQMLDQLKKYPWTPEGDAFYNEYFSFRHNTNYSEPRWEVKIKFESYSYSEYVEVKYFIHPLKFWFLRTFYVNPTLRNHFRIKKEQELSKLSDKFFSHNKNLSRDTKLNQLLNNKN